MLELVTSTALTSWGWEGRTVREGSKKRVSELWTDEKFKKRTKDVMMWKRISSVHQPLKKNKTTHLPVICPELDDATPLRLWASQENELVLFSPGKLDDKKNVKKNKQPKKKVFKGKIHAWKPVFASWYVPPNTDICVTSLCAYASVCCRC